MAKSAVRGRFEIVVPFEDGAYIRVVSDKSRSLTRAEIVAALDEFLDGIRRPAADEQKKPEEPHDV